MPTPNFQRQNARSPRKTTHHSTDWRCTRCAKLLGVNRDGRMHLRFARGHEYFVSFPVWTVAVSTFKSETYRFLRLERPTPEELAAGTEYPPGTLHLPGWIDSEWLKQLVAEQLVTVRNKRGFARLEWQKLRERNEALDCRVYARAAAWILGADRWSEKQWDELERQVAAPGAEVGAGAANAARQSRSGRTTRPANQRRSVRSNYMR